MLVEENKKYYLELIPKINQEKQVLIDDQHSFATLAIVNSWLSNLRDGQVFQGYGDHQSALVFLDLSLELIQDNTFYSPLLA
jgi:hypothetical protein